MNNKSDLIEVAFELRKIRDRLDRAYGHLPSNEFPGPPGSLLADLEDIAQILTKLEAAKLEAQPVGIPAGWRTTIEHCIEYWNGHETEFAMADALHHIQGVLKALIEVAPALPVVGVTAGMKLVTKEYFESAEDILQSAPCECSYTRRFEDGKHLSGCYLFNLNIASREMLSAAPALPDLVPEHCMCEFCKDGVLHASDCAVHNKGVPEMYGPCDCGVTPAAPTVELPVVSLLQECHSSVKYDLQRYEQMLLRNTTQGVFRDALNDECDRLKRLLDDIDAQAAIAGSNK